MGAYKMAKHGYWIPVEGDIESLRQLEHKNYPDGTQRPELLIDADCDECRNRTDDCTLGSDSCHFEEV